MKAYDAGGGPYNRLPDHLRGVNMDSVDAAQGAKVLGKDPVACIQGENHELLSGQRDQSGTEQVVHIFAAGDRQPLGRFINKLLEQFWQGQDRFSPARADISHFEKTLSVQMKDIVDAAVAQHFSGCPVAYYG